MKPHDWIRKGLSQIIEATPGDEISTGFWVGDKAGERRVTDNKQSGRIHWEAARAGAKRGLAAWESGNFEYAELALREGRSLRAIAVEARLKPSELEPLLRDASLRGAKGNARRDARLARAVAEQEAQGIGGKAARENAIRSDPALAQAFQGVGDAGIRAALRRGRLS